MALMFEEKVISDVFLYVESESCLRICPIRQVLKIKSVILAMLLHLLAFSYQNSILNQTD